MRFVSQQYAGAAPDSCDRGEIRPRLPASLTTGADFFSKLRDVLAIVHANGTAQSLAAFPYLLEEAKVLADYLKEISADVIIKGLRVVSDFENEMAFAHMNRSLSGVDTVFLMSDSSYSFVSSSLIKEVFLQGGDIGRYVPDVVLEFMHSKRHVNGRT